VDSPGSPLGKVIVGPDEVLGSAAIPPQKDEVGAAEILGQTDQQVKVSELTATQKAGMYLAKGVGALIFLITVIAVLNYVWFAPRMPTLPENAADAKAVIENHKTVSEIYVAQSTRIFELIVSSALLPVFTAILGYIFGTNQAAQET
jgi:hypothetical protein